VQGFLEKLDKTIAQKKRKTYSNLININGLKLFHQALSSGDFEAQS